ncbi:MAG: PASTA domain-containing protein [Balneolales bacterium]
MNRILKVIKAVLTDPKIYIFVAALFALGAAGIYIFDQVLMPEYTKHGSSLTVPDVTRVSIEEAEQILQDHGLRHELHGTRSNDAYPPDYVVDQTPSASLQVKPNRKVYLTVNTSETPTVTVPDVVNLSLRNAEIQLQNYGLKRGNVIMQSSRYKNSVLEQSVSEGRAVEHGTVVDLIVGDGLGNRMVELPDITGLRYTEAQFELREAGLRSGEIRYEVSEEFEPGIILSYSDNDKDRVYEGTSIDLVISESADAQEETESAPVIEE